jgi:hypothetical protein
MKITNNNLKFFNMKNFICLFFIVAPVFIACTNSNAQWSSNPAVNLTVCDTTGEQVLPKLGITSDGGCYIGWFDNRSGSYAVYLQKLNSQGVKQFPANGLLISNNSQSSSLVDWDLAVDDSDCCVLAFTDTRAGSSINPYAYRISPAGQFLWGANGIALTDSVLVFQANPKVIVTSDGNFVIPWQYNNKIGMQKLNKAGTKLWGSVPLVVLGNPVTGEKFNYPIGVKSDNGSIILYWIGYTGSFISPSNFKTYTQKFSSTGAIQWGNPQDTIWSLGSAQGTYQPSVYSDGNNGAIYVWQSYVAGPTNCYVQRKNSAGQIQFPVNGSTVGDVNSDLRFAPAACYMPSTQETYVFWQEKNSLQSMIGVYGQKFSSDGTKLWPSTGFIFKPLDGNSFNSLWTFSKDTSVIVYYTELVTSGGGLIKAFKINRSGTFLWGGGSIITPGSNPSSKGRMVAGMNQNNMSILAFTDGRNDAGGMYAQNVNYNGTFGLPTGIINFGTSSPDKYQLFQNYPNPFNPTTNIRFQLPANSNVVLKVFDILGKEIETLINENLKAGNYKITFNADKYSSGVYFYKLTAGDYVDVKKMLLVK